MCGIVGYIGEKEATPLLVNALKKLEYRGYDSAGIAVLGNESIVVRKTKGALKNLEQLVIKEVVRGSVGIGHTRWATHGEPSDLNAHPHTNVSGTIAVVHNGIIENFLELKAWLQSQNVVFKSQTDTEVIAHLVHYYYQESGDIFSAVLKALQRLVGSYAVAVISTDYPDRIVCARKESPLVIGVGDGENFIASDVPALLEHTRTVYYLDQNEAAVLYADHVDLFKTTGEHIVREPSHVAWDMSAAEKGGYQHFMLKEIFEQPKALNDTVHPRFVFEGDAPIDLRFDAAAIDDFWNHASRILITACGTAYHAGIVAKYAFEKLTRIPVQVEVASEFRYMNPIFNADDIFIVISQSGETADTLAALRLAKSRGVKVVAITNCVGSTITREADYVIYTWAGPEIAVASTKAYTTQLMCLYMLALKAGFVRGILPKQQYLDLLKELQEIPTKAEEILQQQSEIQKFASLHFNKSPIFYIGRQFDSATSLESALKLKEVSYIHSEAFAAGELKHGPIALVDKNTLVVGIASVPELFEKIGSNIVECKSRNCAALVITTDASGYFSQLSDTVITIPKTNEVFAAALAIIPAQLFAYYCAVLLGYDPDKPRNLAKSVTVE
ncbi:MAG: glutamine--fructose-6-phosphate transaminase (isomerizing) [Treponema sp.]|nr:glutamine--fructose-6-phosphate transaminase (isomerizing) [Treponema sp.]